MKTAINFFKLTFTVATFFLASSQTISAQTAMFVANNGTVIEEQIGEYTESGARIISDYTEGIAITEKNNRFGLVNKQGFEVCAPQYDEIRPFVNGYAAVRVQNYWTLLNKQGQRLTNARFDWVSSFHNGFAAVNVGGKWGFMNEQGLMVTPIKYDRVAYFEEGVAPVKVGEQWLYINERGEEMSIAEELMLDLHAQI